MTMTALGGSGGGGGGGGSWAAGQTRPDTGGSWAAPAPKNNSRGANRSRTGVWSGSIDHQPIINTSSWSPFPQRPQYLTLPQLSVRGRGGVYLRVGGAGSSDGPSHAVSSVVPDRGSQSVYRVVSRDPLSHQAHGRSAEGRLTTAAAGGCAEPELPPPPSSTPAAWLRPARRSRVRRRGRVDFK